MKRILCAVVFLIVSATLGFAGTIDYTFTGTATGSIGGTDFTDVLLTINAVGDTTATYPLSFDTGFWNNSLSATVNIPGVGTATFTEPTRVFDNQTVDAVGFNSLSHADLFDLSGPPAYATYDLTTSIGPITSDAYFVIGQFTDVSTSLGLMTVTSGYDTGTFQAQTGTAIPEPPAAVLAATFGFAFLAFVASRRMGVM